MKKNAGMYDKRLIKMVEKCAYLQLDHLNHCGIYADMRDYITFDYNGTMIVDPWQREDFQYGDCIWVEYDENIEIHRGEHVVNPFCYYGSERMNDFIGRMLAKIEINGNEV